MADLKPKQVVTCHPPHWSEPGEVRIMEVAGGYAMVRRKGCAPFAVSVKYLSTKDTPND